MTVAKAADVATETLVEFAQIWYQPPVPSKWPLRIMAMPRYPAGLDGMLGW